jgi:NhaA family Na+:H+ antiporter|tara:strand:+ start:912 stop:2243 length:1332 start_codon:yes stop_codon:yes gene_type:complete
MVDIPKHRAETKGRIFVIIKSFLAKEAYSGILLFGAALLAMILANSSWSQHYFDLWHTSMGLEIGGRILDMDLGHWVNDGFMALFFLLIGLEIKRELMVGELSSLRKAAFPLIAAVGGIFVPVLFYLAVNFRQDGQLLGFGIPMATDIAFALGFLLLLGSRVPLALKIFLTSLAVFDDLGAVILVALFYTSSFDLLFLGYAAATLVALVLLNRFGINKLMPYLLLGILLWFWVEASGIHATIAGILLAFTIPVRSRINSERFLDISRYELDAFDKHETNRKSTLLTPEQQDSLETIEDAYEAVQNPLVRLEHSLHPISAFLIIPLFAFANAGVQITGVGFQLLSPVNLGILLGLTLGKPLGIIGITYITERLGWVQKPSSLSWKHIIGAGILGGIGFTMSIFITQLAFEDAAIIASAKLIILACSLVMGIVGVIYLARQKNGS